MSKTFSLSYTVLLVLFLTVLQVWTMDNFTNLQQKLAVFHKDYNMNMEPRNTTMKVGLKFLCARYNSYKGVVESRVIQLHSWSDWRVRWDPTQYGGIKRIAVPSDLIWTPDIRLWNGMTNEEKYGKKVLVFYDGRIVWHTPVTYHTLCENKDRDQEQGDRHHKPRHLHCHFQIASWVYDHPVLPLSYDGIDTSMFYDKDCPYTVENPTAVIQTKTYPVECCPEPYDTLETNIDVKLREHPEDHVEHHRKRSKHSRKCQWPYC